MIGLALAGWPRPYRWLLLAVGPAALLVLGWFFYFVPQLTQQRRLRQQHQHLQARLAALETQIPALDHWPRPAASSPANTLTAAGFWPRLLQAAEHSGMQLESFQLAAGREQIHLRMRGAYPQLTALFTELARADFAPSLRWCALQIAPSAGSPILRLEAEAQLDANAESARRRGKGAVPVPPPRVRP